MNSSSKVPPRFVPTLTEVVGSVADVEATGDESARDSAPDESPGKAARVLSQPEAQESAPLAARASFHSPWLADGLYVRSKPATIPHQLPPLPESLPPQQPFALSTDMDTAANTGAAEVSDLTVQQTLAAEALPVPSGVYAQSTGAEVQAITSFSAGETTSIELFNEQPASGDEQAPLTQVATKDLLHHLMLRVDLLLEKRLQEVVEQVVEVQTRSLALRLREEVESVVRRSVYEAVETELELQAQQSNEE